MLQACLQVGGLGLIVAHMMRTLLGYIAFAMFALAMLAGFAAAEPVRIFAASSLKSVMDEIAPDMPFPVSISYGGSAAMARQVAQGAPADIVLLAHEAWMDWLDMQGHLGAGTRCDLLGNRLVLATGAEGRVMMPRSGQELVDLLDGGRLAVGNFRSVPAGQYAQAWLESEGWLDVVRPHLAQLPNVRLVLALIARQEAPLGVVYASDVHAEPRVKAVLPISLEKSGAIVYPIALTADAGGESEAVRDAIIKSTDVFEEHGFAPLASDHAGLCR